MTIFEYDEEEHMRLERAGHYEKGLEQGSNSKLMELIEKKLAKGKVLHR